VGLRPKDPRDETIKKAANAISATSVHGSVSQRARGVKKAGQGALQSDGNPEQKKKHEPHSQPLLQLDDETRREKKSEWAKT